MHIGHRGRKRLQPTLRFPVLRIFAPDRLIPVCGQDLDEEGADERAGEGFADGRFDVFLVDAKDGGEVSVSDLGGQLVDLGVVEGEFFSREGDGHTFERLASEKLSNNMS
jgi:hypothetical protein